MVEQDYLAEAQDYLGDSVVYLDISTNDAWARDTGPTILLNDKREKLAVDWSFNAWGGAVDGLYQDYEDDDQVASRFAEALEMPVYNAKPFVLEGKTSTKIETAALDADKVEEVIALIESYKPEAVLNVALPYQDLTIMDACLATGVHYIDTANYEAEDTEDPEWRAIYEKRCKDLGFTAYFDYSWQWAYQEKFKEQA